MPSSFYCSEKAWCAFRWRLPCGRRLGRRRWRRGALRLLGDKGACLRRVDELPLAQDGNDRNHDVGEQRADKEHQHRLEGEVRGRGVFGMRCPERGREQHERQRHDDPNKRGRQKARCATSGYGTSVS
jgi:hypothetical protein